MIQCNKLWIHAQIATMSDQSGYGLIENGAIAVDEGQIVWLGKFEDLPDNYLANETIDCSDQLITPGFTDCHTHVVYGGQRANEFEMRLNGASYSQIAMQGGGIQSTVNATRIISEDDLFFHSLKRVKKMIFQGVRILEIKSGYGLDLANELKMLRVAKRIEEATNLNIQTTFLGAHAIPNEYHARADEYVELICQTMIPEVARLELADAVDAFCEGIGFSTKQVEKIFQAAKHYGLPVKLHAEQLSNLGGTQLAARYQALSSDHLEYLTEPDVHAMAEAGMVAVLLPGAFYFLKETQKPPIDLLRKYKVPIAIATDCNPGSSPTTSLPLMMNMACTLFGLTVEEVFRAVTINAVKALGLPDSAGMIKQDEKANFVCWDCHTPAELVCEIGSACTMH